MYFKQKNNDDSQSVSKLSSSKSLINICVLSIVTLLCLTACVTPIGAIVKVNSKEDIPDITQQYQSQISQLKVGMSKSQVIALFPPMERECYPSGTCHFTVFNEDIIQIDHRIGDLNLLTSSLISMLALTCILSSEECTEAMVAALNLSIAASVKSHQIHTSSSNSNVLTLLQWINIELVNGKVTQWAINEPLPQYQPKSHKNQLPNLEQSLQL